MEPLYLLKLPINNEYKELIENIILILIVIATSSILSTFLFKKMNNIALLNILVISVMIYHLIFKLLFKVELIETMVVRNNKRRRR